MKIDWQGTLRARIYPRLTMLYGSEHGERAWNLIAPLFSHYAPIFEVQQNLGSGWSERDVVLITYGDQVSRANEAPIATQHKFLHSSGLGALINTVHFLPFYPHSSDDGFSVVDYKAVNPEWGSWNDVVNIGHEFRLMFDYVVNHISKQSEWFQSYLKGIPPYTDFFVEADPSLDLSAVLRPRSLPLLTPFETSRGTRHLWTTFSDDQVDLNFSEPAVLAAMIDVLLFYLTQGARLLRLDAVNYVWKEIGTSCTHLPQAHEIVKVVRDICDWFAPGTVVVSETNVPHQDNISYFGDGDEVHMVYNFSLPPLLFEAFLSSSTDILRTWAKKVCVTHTGTTFFNFTASHDGIGVRGAQGYIEGERFDRMISAVKSQGGQVSTRRTPEGTDVPYEMNISYFDALAGAPGEFAPELQVRRFLMSQAFALSLRGIPGVYFHSLFGTRNHTRGVELTGRARSINRRKFELDELNAMLDEPETQHRAVFEGYKKLLGCRVTTPAFNPDAPQEILDFGDDAVIGVLRGTASERVFCVYNFAPTTKTISLPKGSYESLTDASHSIVGESVTLEPYGFRWLRVA